MLRRPRFVVFAAVGISIVGLGISQSQSAKKDFRISLSVSPFTELRFRNGTTFTDGKTTAKDPAELQRMFIRHGANEVYARIATTQNIGQASAITA